MTIGQRGPPGRSRGGRRVIVSNVRGAALAVVGALAAVLLASSASSAATGDAGVLVTSQAQTKLAADAHASWVEIPASWAAMEPSPGSYKDPGGPGTDVWAALASELSYAKSLGLKTLVVVDGAPSWARADGGVNPADPSRYAAFLSDLATKLGPSIDAYTPWQEPNQQHHWGTPNAAAYTALQKAAYPALKSADPTATVLSAPVAPIAPDQTGIIRGGGIVAYDWVQQIYAAGIKGSFDALAWNAYGPGAPEDEFPDSQGRPHPGTLPALVYLQTILNTYDPGRPVWVTEINWST